MRNSRLIDLAILAPVLSLSLLLLVTCGGGGGGGSAAPPPSPSPTAMVTTLAGLYPYSGSTDGTGAQARFTQPMGVAVDGSGNVYVADTGNFVFRKVGPTGSVVTIAAPAYVGQALKLALDGGGGIYYTDNKTICRVTSSGVITTLAGSPGVSGSADGTGAAARFTKLMGVAADRFGNVYVTDNNTIRKITATGVVTTLAGSPGVSGSVDGTGAGAHFYNPWDLCVDSFENVYVVDTDNNTIRKVTPGGVVSTLAGTPGVIGSADGTGATAQFNSPRGVAVDQSGNIYVADTVNSTIRKVTAAGVVTTYAGKANTWGAADGSAISTARFTEPYGVTVDASGKVFVADTNNHTIRLVTPAP